MASPRRRKLIRMRIGGAARGRPQVHVDVGPVAIGIVCREGLVGAVGVRCIRRLEVAALGGILDPGQLLTQIGCSVLGIGIYLGRIQFTIRKGQFVWGDKGWCVKEALKVCHVSFKGKMDKETERRNEEKEKKNGRHDEEEGKDADKRNLTLAADHIQSSPVNALHLRPPRGTRGTGWGKAGAAI